MLFLIISLILLILKRYKKNFNLFDYKLDKNLFILYFIRFKIIFKIINQKKLKNL